MPKVDITDKKGLVISGDVKSGGLYRNGKRLSPTGTFGRSYELFLESTNSTSRVADAPVTRACRLTRIRVFTNGDVGDPAGVVTVRSGDGAGSFTLTDVTLTVSNSTPGAANGDYINGGPTFAVGESIGVKMTTATGENKNFNVYLEVQPTS